MLYKVMDSTEYIKEFKKRFSNFCEKSPILLSFVIIDNRVDIVLEDTDEVLSFPFQYSIDVKSFIFGIRQILITRAYPKIEKVETTEVEVSLEEQRLLAQKGMPVEDIPSKRLVERVTQYLIDRVIIYKDIFILKDRATEQMYRYKLNKSSVFFLKKIKRNALSERDAGALFFENATLLNEILPYSTKESED